MPVPSPWATTSARDSSSTRRLPGRCPLKQVNHHSTTVRCEEHCNFCSKPMVHPMVRAVLSCEAAQKVVSASITASLVCCRHAERCSGLCARTEALFRCHGVCTSSSQCCLHGSGRLSPCSLLEVTTNNRLMSCKLHPLLQSEALAGSCHTKGGALNDHDYLSEQHCVRD